MLSPKSYLSENIIIWFLGVFKKFMWHCKFIWTFPLLWCICWSKCQWLWGTSDYRWYHFLQVPDEAGGQGGGGGTNLQCCSLPATAGVEWRAACCATQHGRLPQPGQPSAAVPANGLQVLVACVGVKGLISGAHQLFHTHKHKHAHSCRWPGNW